jgi:hypothetical protein
MPFRISPVEREECVLVAFEGDTPSEEIAAVRQEVETLLTARRWRHVLVDATAMHTVLNVIELFELGKRLLGNLPRDARVALVVRENQASHARFLEKSARGNGLFLTFFVEAQRAQAWIRRDSQERSSLLHRLGKQAAKVPKHDRPRPTGIL